MRIIFLISIFLFASIFLCAQDTLYKTNGSKQLVKILEVNTSQVKYKRDKNIYGPTYVITKEDVLKIVYESGNIDVFSNKMKKVSPILNINKNPDLRDFEDPRRKDLGQNFISLNILDFIHNSLTVSYEYTFKFGGTSIKIPLSIGLTTNPTYSYGFDLNGYYNPNKIFSTGIDLYFYPFGQGKTKFYYGPSIEYGKFKYLTYSIPNEMKGSFYSIILEFGFLNQPSKHFNISFNAGLGYTQIRASYPESWLTFRFGINAGYKF